MSVKLNFFPVAPRRCYCCLYDADLQIQTARNESELRRPYNIKSDILSASNTEYVRVYVDRLQFFLTKWDCIIFAPLFFLVFSFLYWKAMRMFFK
jgi:hypothetical protein